MTKPCGSTKETKSWGEHNFMNLQYHTLQTHRKTNSHKPHILLKENLVVAHNKILVRYVQLKTDFS